MNFIPLANTEPFLPTESHTISDLDTNEIIMVGLDIKRRTYNGQTIFQYADDIVNGVHQNYLTRDEFPLAFGAEDSDLDVAQTYYESLGIQTINRSQFAATLTLSGSVSQFNTAFKTTLHQVNLEDSTYRSYSGSLSVPEHLDGIVINVLDMHNPGEFRPHFQTLPSDISADTPHASAQALTPAQVAKAYNFPNINGSGTCVGIIELGGGYYLSEVNTSFDNAGITRPTMVDVSVNGGTNSPDSPYGASGEVNLDIYVAGGVAPGCTIAVYFVPQSLTCYRDAVNTALADTTNNPMSISISWGRYEGDIYGRFYWLFSDGALASATSMGIPVCVSSGDYGSSGQYNTTAGGGSYPALSSYVLGTGGTTLVLNPDNSINSEVVWNSGSVGSGGGPATWIGIPSWQNGLTYTPYPGGSPTSLGSARWSPDVAGNGDPVTGYRFISVGSQIQVGGTSAAAPLWAGMLALFAKSLGKPAGYINNLLYSNPSLFRDITSGNNACPASTGYSATSGWDACTGLGTPNATAILNKLIATQVNITLSPTSISNLQVGTTSNTTINASGGTSPYTFAVTSGSLPDGINLTTTSSTTCTLSGTPTVANTFSFTIRATDANNNTGSQAYSVTVLIATPVTANVSQTVPYNSTSNIALSITGVVTNVQVNTQASYGVATATGTNISYTSTTGYYGTDSFKYTANNAGGISNISTANINVLPAPPVTGNVRQIIVFNTSNNLISLNVSGVLSSVQVTSQASHGTATANGTSITYTPTIGYYGIDSFTYTANNAGGISNTSKVSLLIPQPPVTSNVNNTIAYNSSNNIINLNVTGNYFSVIVNSQPSHGTTSVNGITVLYTPNTGFYGNDSFTYSANNLGSLSNISTINIVIPNPPTTSNVISIIEMNTHANVVPLIISGSYNQIYVNTQPTNGTALVIGQTISYIPNPGFFGTDTFTYYASNSGSNSNISTVTMQVFAEFSSNSKLTAQFRRGTTSQIQSFIGKIGEIIYDTIVRTLVVLDGILPGGHYIGKQSDLISGITQIQSNTSNINVILNCTYTQSNTAISESIVSNSQSNNAIQYLSANVIYTSGVDATQNTTINSTRNFAQAAYNRANSALATESSILAFQILAQSASDAANSALESTNNVSGGSF